jgi:uncharacterized protein DUF4190
MKRCPTCNQVFTEDWLTFCTSDGTSLVVEPVGSSTEPPATVVMPPPPVTGSQEERPTMMRPDPFSAGSPVRSQQQSAAPVWQPPPPPLAPASRQQSFALLSLVLGIVSITVGWCCYFGVLTSPVAIGLGIFALLKAKNDPAHYGGKGMAIGGIVTGALYFVFVALIILIYGLSFLMSGLR